MTDAGFNLFTLNPTAQEFRPNYTRYTFPPPPLPPPLFTTVQQPPFTTLPPPSTLPTRTLLLCSVPTNVSESTVRRDLELFGDVRAVQMERLRDGIVTVHFYDIRQSIKALTEIQQQHMQHQYRLRKYFDEVILFFPNSPLPHPPPARGLLSGRAIWAQFTFPIAGGIPDGYNQGTVVIVSDVCVSTAIIRETFEVFGCLKEIRDFPLRKKQKIVEFFDIRNAAKAVLALNGKEVNGKPVVVEFGRVGGVLYRPPPPKDRLVDYNVGRDENKVISPRDGVKKNGKSFYTQPEQQVRLVSNGCDSVNGGRNKQWKGSRYIKENCDFRFLIKQDAIASNFRDPRTTVMIKNIPNKYSQKLLLNMLDSHCKHCNERAEADCDDHPLSSYDFVYLPIDFVNKCNVGYGFVNMTSPEATWRLYKSFHHQNWEVFNSKKICEVSYARLQGLEALKEHFKNSKFPEEAEEYMPVIFTPPRDGQTTTDPKTIIGLSTTTTATSLSSSFLSEVGFRDLTNSGRSSDDNGLLVEYTKSEATITTTTDGGDGDGDGDVM